MEKLYKKLTEIIDEDKRECPHYRVNIPEKKYRELLSEEKQSSYLQILENPFLKDIQRREKYCGIVFDFVFSKKFSVKGNGVERTLSL